MSDGRREPTDGLEARLPSATRPRVRRVVGLVDTDSFAKWGAHLLADAPAHWQLELLVVDTPRSASPAQLRSAFRGLDGRLGHLAAAPPAPLGVDALVDRLRADPPDAVLVACIGPVAELLVDEVVRRVPRRPVLLTGLPGISYPAKWKGVFFRARADVFVLHSHREVRAYRALASAGGIEPAFALATLPFARSRGQGGLGDERAGGRGDERGRDAVVFAAQPSVPADLEDRRRVVGWLVETARRHPEWRVVVKVRAAAGEHQTHREQWPYPELLPADRPANLVVESGPMAQHLDRAVALVTISSTAVLEAVARGVPALTLTDFGVSRALINEVFVDSGLEGDAVDLVEGRFGTVRPEWLHDNHFHPPAEDDWADRAEELMALRDAGALEVRPAARRSGGGALRRAWERKNALGSADRTAIGVVALVLGTPVRTVKRVLRRLRRVVLRPDASDAALVLPPRSQRDAVGAGTGGANRTT
ncbi:hypothetical protein GCM10009706_08250 [Curtobacterium citreum]|uniref:CDP-glycerol:poly(Glycerophosphate) glycerophosphotransferase n=1 Tax=Curtobacterium citreum TaxID=2036 RepID=A0ABT2HFA2_9MICO|nr:DUF6716 putative glycosyltransferase [Curtobacterium citreum]MCS6521935.1 hypothetical protein [Curtobacterium citreum]GGL72290.1 hypothetical protein GCM10009706_08250 [Curtobacterium citreum]